MDNQEKTITETMQKLPEENTAQVVQKWRGYLQNMKDNRMEEEKRMDSDSERILLDQYIQRVAEAARDMLKIQKAHGVQATADFVLFMIQELGGDEKSVMVMAPLFLQWLEAVENLQRPFQKFLPKTV